MAKKSLVQLAHTYNPDKNSLGGWFMSEKLDGMRAWWDGGITRGLPASGVPWANCEKHARFKEEVIATGLWSRYGQPIQAPDWWLDLLPGFCCDGELWLGRKQFQKLVSITKTMSGASDWSNVKYMVFDVPSPFDLFADRTIDETNIKLSMRGCLDWVQHRLVEKNAYSPEFLHMTWTFEQTQQSSQVQAIVNGVYAKSGDSPIVVWTPQTRLSKENWREELQAAGENYQNSGAEGIIVRHPFSIWTPERIHDMLKVKPRSDASHVWRWGANPNA